MAETHALKVWLKEFEGLRDGSKTFEIRFNDRGFSVGDTLLLRKYDRYKQQYTGDELTRVVSYILADEAFGLRPGFVVLGLAIPANPESDAATPPPQEQMDLADVIMQAIIACGHEIDEDSIVLKFSHKQEGHNALNQLHRRIRAALSSTTEGQP